MRDAKELFEQRQMIEAKTQDVSQIPRQPSGLVLESDRKKWADILEHNDRVFHELQKFNAGLTKAEKRAIVAYKREHQSVNKK